MKIHNNHVFVLSTKNVHNKQKQQVYNKDCNKYQSIEWLDKYYKHCLLYLMDSWNQVEKNNIIKIGANWWDINIILNHYSAQLNRSNMENPYPVYPSDPFTKTLITKKDVKNIVKKIKQLSLNINLSLKLFLLSKNIDLFYDQATLNYNNHSIALLDLFNTKLRYKLINNKDSQNSYTGYWTQRTMCLSRFEKLYNLIKQTPMYVIDLDNFSYINPEINKIKKQMDNINEQNDVPVVPI